MAAATSPTSTGRPAKSGHAARRTVASPGRHRSESSTSRQPERCLPGRATRRHAARALQDDRGHAGGAGHGRGRALDRRWRDVRAGGARRGALRGADHRRPRPGLVTADVDAAGRVYVAWGDCRFSPDCDDERHRLRDVRRRRPLDGAATRAIPEQPGARLVRARARGRTGHVRRTGTARRRRVRGDAERTGVATATPSTRSRSRRPTAVVPGAGPSPQRRADAGALAGRHRRGPDARRLRLDVVRRRTPRRGGLARDETPSSGSFARRSSRRASRRYHPS